MSSPLGASNPPPAASPSERRRRNREQMAEAILQTARSLMREHGVGGLSLHELGRRLGMRAPSLYEYFPGKMAIYDALFLAGVRMLGERFGRVIQKRAAFWDRFRAAFEAHLSFAQENPELFHLCFERPVPGFVPSEESMQASRSLLLEPGRRMIQEAIESGEIAPGLPTSQAGDLMVAAMHGLASRHVANEPHLPPGEGRFGSLIPATVALFQASWVPKQSYSGEEQHGRDR